MTDLTFGLAPFLPADPNRVLACKAYRLAQKSAALSSVPPATRAALQDMLRSVSTYYSNLIEGQSTHPMEVDRAVRTGEQAEAPGVLISLAVREAQEIMDTRSAMENHERPTSPDFIQQIHQLIFDKVPLEERRVHTAGDELTAVVEPGMLRTNPVQVGRHVAIDDGLLPAALVFFDRHYRPDQEKLQGDQGLIAAAAAHHRLAYLHPFLDGNGRVARLFSGVYIDSVLEQPAIWSLSRGLARKRNDYYRFLSGADAPPQGSTDGRGPRSQRALHAFCDFFLDQCLDQVDYMASVSSVDGYKRRVDFLVSRASEGALPDVPTIDGSAADILKALFSEGELTRAEASRRTGYKERKGRMVIAQLLESGLVVSPNQKGPLHPAFPPLYLEYLFPKMASPLA